jgi:tripartite-type tricarboxylate transporter receptor subunit TctC
VEFVKRARPDGLTILQIPASIMTLYPHIYKNLAYNPLTDFAPVTTTATYVYSFTASSALPATVRTVADFVAWARANPTISSYGIPAAGSSLHFAGMMLQRAAGIEFTAVPYRGGAPLLTDMLAGVIPVSFNVLGEVLPHIRSGKLRSLAVCSPERSRFLADVPTMVEQGIQEIALTEWLGWFLPRQDAGRYRAPIEPDRARRIADRGNDRRPCQRRPRAPTHDAGTIRGAVEAGLRPLGRHRQVDRLHHDGLV